MLLRWGILQWRPIRFKFKPAVLIRYCLGCKIWSADYNSVMCGAFRSAGNITRNNPTFLNCRPSGNTFLIKSGKGSRSLLVTSIFIVYHLHLRLLNYSTRNQVLPSFMTVRYCWLRHWRADLLSATPVALVSMIYLCICLFIVRTSPQFIRDWKHVKQFKFEFKALKFK